MASEEPAGATSPRIASLWPTAVALILIFAGGVYASRSTESSMVVGVVALSSFLLAAAGTAGHALSGLWKRFRGRSDAARNSGSRALLYLAFGIASVAAARLHGGSVEEFRAELQPGISVHETLRRLDAFYAGRPRRFRFVSLWGTQKELALEDYGRIEVPEEGAVLFTWRAGETRSTEIVTQTAEALARTRQVWITFRTDVGFIHFFVTLDGRGVMTHVSSTTGHQA